MTRPYLLVTGSRALADRDDSATWARARIEEALAAMPRSTRVLTGDARGPDAWAIRARHPWTAFTGTGSITVGASVPEDWPGVAHGDHEGWWTGAERPPVPQGRDEWRRRLLARDRALVAFAALCASRGELVRVLALRAPWAETHGTDYTATRAREAGLPVTLLTYPEVL